MDCSIMLDFRGIVTRWGLTLLAYVIFYRPSIFYELFEWQLFFSDNGLPLKRIPTHTPKWLGRQMKRHPYVNVLGYIAFMLATHTVLICGVLYTVITIIFAREALSCPLSSTVSRYFIVLTEIALSCPVLWFFVFKVFDIFSVAIYHLRNSPIWHKIWHKK